MNQLTNADVVEVQRIIAGFWGLSGNRLKVFLEGIMFNLLEIDSVSKSALPQMDAGIACGKGYNPLHELMRAMVLRAVEDYNSGGELRDDAIKYFYAEEDDSNDDEDEYILSFAFICRHLGMDPEKTRYAIMNATHRISTRRRAA